MTLGSKLQSLRESQALSQKELANLIDVTTGTIAEWEADDAVPSIAELSRLSKAFNVSSDVLLDAIMEHPTTQIATPKPTPIATSTPPKKRKKIWLLAGASILVVAIIAILLSGHFIDSGNSSFDFSEDTSAIEAADASVVMIYCYDYDGALAATGSGFVAFNGKTIITNYHVMTSAYTCKVSTNQDISYEVANILCYSKEQDIAILELAKDTSLQPLTLGNSSSIKKGESVVAIGSPLGIKNTVSTGVLSGRLMVSNMDVLQFTAPISSGSSGGALFDNSGNVIGITFASLVDGQNLNLAIPIELAVNLYQKTSSAVGTVSHICKAEHPYIQYLESHNSVIAVTLEDLKHNPETYSGCVIKLSAYVSSYAMDLDNGNVVSLYASNKREVSANNEYDWNRQFCVNFETHPFVHCRVHTCEVSPNGLIQSGQNIIIVGTFDYQPHVLPPEGSYADWREMLDLIHSEAYIEAKYIDIIG